jgi:hypothetical protein
LDKDEFKLLKDSAAILKDTITSLNLWFSL